jgi:hypothetical protein
MRLAGIAITADPRLKLAVNKLCSVRRKSLGQVTVLARAAHKNDKEAQSTIRKQKAEIKHDANIRKQARTAAARDKAEETASNSLCTDLQTLDVQLKARSNNKESRISFLKFTHAFLGNIRDHILTWAWNGVRQVAK